MEELFHSIYITFWGRRHILSLLTKQRKPFKVTLAGGSGARNKCSETKAEYNENYWSMERCEKAREESVEIISSLSAATHALARAHRITHSMSESSSQTNECHLRGAEPAEHRWIPSSHSSILLCHSLWCSGSGGDDDKYYTFTDLHCN